MLKRSILTLTLIAFAGALLPGQTPEQESERQKTKEFIQSIKWQPGPSKADLQGHAEIDVPEGFLFAGGDDTRRLMEFMQNPASGREVGFLTPQSFAWFLTFEFSDVGYVKDDDKNKLDADALLDSIKAGTEAANEIRKKRGWPELRITGWFQPPKYNPVTNNLEWAIKGSTDNAPVVNYSTRLLGRYGVMEVNLVGSPDQMAEVVPVYSDILGHYEFKAGKTYAEFKPGDKIAKYGLIALVTGAAAVVATKTGVFGKMWGLIVLLAVKGAKLIAVGIAAVAAALKKLFSRKKPATETSAPQ